MDNPSVEQNKELQHLLDDCRDSSSQSKIPASQYDTIKITIVSENGEYVMSRYLISRMLNAANVSVVPNSLD